MVNQQRPCSGPQLSAWRPGSGGGVLNQATLSWEIQLTRSPGAQSEDGHLCIFFGSTRWSDDSLVCAVATGLGCCSFRGSRVRGLFHSVVLDLECPPKLLCQAEQQCPEGEWWDHEGSVLVSARSKWWPDKLDLLGSVKTTGRWGRMEEVCHWRCGLGCYMRPWPLPVFLFLLPGCRKLSGFPPPYRPPWCSASCQTQRNGASLPWAGSSETVSRIHLSTFRLFLSCILITAKKSWLTQVVWCVWWTREPGCSEI